MLKALLIVPLLLLLTPGRTEASSRWLGSGLDNVDMVHVEDPGGGVRVLVGDDIQQAINVTITISPDDPNEPDVSHLVDLTCSAPGNRQIGPCRYFTMVGDTLYTLQMRFHAEDLFQSSVIGNIKARLVAEPAEVLGLPPLPVVIVDTRKLHVGFTEDKLELHDSSISIHVAALDMGVALSQPLDLLVSLNEDNSEHVTIDPGDTTEHLVIFMGLEPFQNYQASLSVGTPELVDQVTLGPPLQRNIPTNELLSVITALQKEVLNLASQVADLNQQLSDENRQHTTASAPPSTTTTGGFTTVESPLPTTYPPTTQPTQPRTTYQPHTTQPRTTQPHTTQPRTTQPHTTAKPSPCTKEQCINIKFCSDDSMCGDDSVCKDGTCVCKDGFIKNLEGNCVVNAKDGSSGTDGFSSLWYLLGGFVVVLVSLVPLYLLFSHREKVRACVVSRWKGARNGGTPPLKTRGHDYAPLPTNIHDTRT